MQNYSLTGLATSLLHSAKRNSVVLSILLSLSIVVGLLTSTLRGDLTGQPVGSDIGVSSSATIGEDQARACSSIDTPFHGVSRPIDATALFAQHMETIVNERWNLLQSPLAWPCFSASGQSPQPSMPVLQALAAQLPGWTYMDQNIRKPKPVLWENFSSIVNEFEREYECTLNEFEDDPISLVLRNGDVEGNGAAPNAPQFCTQLNGNGCRSVATAGTNGESCDPDGYRGTDPTCGGVSIDLSAGDLSGRLAGVAVRMEQERKRARIAVERTLLALRSLEMHVPFTIATNCLQRATLDLENQEAMLADAISCMPKIWDATMSLHDKL